MAIESIASVKSHFQSGDRPTQVEFEGLIDTLGRLTPIAIASAAEGGKTGLIEILGDGDVTARSIGAFGRDFIAADATASAQNAFGITSVASIFLAAESTASGQSLLGISSHQATFLLAESTASSQSLLGGGTRGVAVFEAITTASAQDALGVREITTGTAIATTSGTAHDFTNIPPWVKRITVTFGGVSLSGTDFILIQIGTVSGVETTGYLSACARIVSAANAFQNATNGFVVDGDSDAGAAHGAITLTLASGTTWVASGATWFSATALGVTSGSKTLSAALDRVRITRSGTDTFDAGSVNILYE